MRALVKPFKVSLEIKKEGKLGSKNTTGTSQSLTFEEQNFHGHLSRKKSVRKNNHSKINFVLEKQL